MRLLLGIVKLVALVFMVVVSSSVQQAVGVGAIRLHDRKTDGKEWTEERMKMRAYMAMDYGKTKRHHDPKHN
ncbi:uncharacterized protein [Lolium perenne]|uniref:uncharacterized protein n=1 Tax=Lolium perenne TaxID=4522 RepID=UPI0021EAC39E